MEYNANFFITDQDWQIPFQRCPEMKHSLFMSNAYFENMKNRLFDSRVNVLHLDSIFE